MTEVTLREIEVQKLSLTPNDTLILYLPQTEWSDCECAQVAEYLREFKIKYLILRKEKATFEVLEGAEFP